MEPLYNGHLWGTMFGPYTEVAFVERLYKLFIWDLGAWPLYSSWPLFGGGC